MGKDNAHDHLRSLPPAHRDLRRHPRGAPWHGRSRLHGSAARSVARPARASAARRMGGRLRTGAPAPASRPCFSSRRSRAAPTRSRAAMPATLCLMDLIYGAPPAEATCRRSAACSTATSSTRRASRASARGGPSSRARSTRVAAGRPHARVLSVASGHLREIEWSRAGASGAASVTAIDQDRDSLACIERLTTGAIRCRHRRGDRRRPAAPLGALRGRRSGICRRSLRLPRRRLARALTATLFRTLAPGRPAADRQLHAGHA